MNFCPKCGNIVPDDAVFCSYCRTPIPDSNISYRQILAKKERPLGIALLAIFEIIIAIFGLLFGALITTLGAMVGLLSWLPVSNLFSLLSGATVIVGIAFLIMSVLWFVVGYGLWHGSSWAWGSQLALSIIGIIVSIVMAFTIILIGVGIMVLIINTLIIFYLMLTHVRKFFEKTSPLPAWRPPPPPPLKL
jgi:hypothetical protein